MEEKNQNEGNPKGKRGAPFGNQNARSHGFYSNVLTRQERRILNKDDILGGLDGEIALLRVKVQSLIARDPDNMELITRAVNSLARLITAKNKLAGQSEVELRNALAFVLKSRGLSEGIPLEKNVPGPSND